MKKITNIFEGKTKRKKPDQKLVKAALKTHSKIRKTEKPLSNNRNATLKNKSDKLKQLRRYEKESLSEPQYSTHDIAKKKIIKPSYKSFISRKKAQ